MRSNIKDLIGQRFGRLTVLSYVYKKERGSHWLCKCDCGQEKIIPGEYLTRGKTKSCGCLRKDGINNKAGGRKGVNLTGQEFGFLTALKPTDKRNNGSIVWECKCKCGNQTLASERDLMNGGKISCGCLKSLGEANITALLQENHINFVREYNIVINEKYRRYDFAILEDNKIIRLIEFDGPQHNQQKQLTGYFSNLKDTIQISDKEKNEWALNNNIPLVRIPYDKRDNITLEDIFSDTYLVIRELN